MLRRAIAARYANALFGLASEKDALDKIEADFPQFVSLLESDSELNTFLTHPIIAQGDKKDLITNTFSGKINDILFDLIVMCIDKKREVYIPMIWDDFKLLLMEYRGQLKATVYSPYELSTELQRNMIDGLSKSTGKTVLLDQVVDTTLIGGVKVQIMDRVYDGTVVSKLAVLKESMLSAKV